MAHHGITPFDGKDPAFQRRAQLMRELLNTTSFRGAVGDYPDGKLTKSDEGSLQFAIGEQNGKVVIDFGTPVQWVGMTPQQAAEFASSLLAKAREVGRKRGETVTLIIGNR